MLNGKELVRKEIITNVPKENIAQVGVDLNVIAIEKITQGGFGIIPVKGKTTLVSYEKVIATTVTKGSNEHDFYETDVWLLSPGMYNVTFKQGCKIPNDVMLLIRQRSSLLRNGVILHSSVFDPGFETNNIGTMIVVHHPIEIECGARIAQIYGHSCLPVENLYDGQFQNDKQRN